MNVKTWLINIGIVLSVSPSVGWAANHRAVVQEQVVSDVSAVSAQQAGQSAKREQQAKVTAELNGSQWSLEFTSMSGEKPKKPLTDTLEFSGGKVKATKLASQGFPTTNYTLMIGDDGVPVWETMQSSEKGDVAFWRGELHGETMSGILSQHPADGGTEDFSFKGERTGEAAAQPAPAEPQVVAPMTEATPAPVVATPPVTTPAAPAAKPAEKKKGWFGF